MVLPYTWNSSPGFIFGGILTWNTVVSALSFGLFFDDLCVSFDGVIGLLDWSFSVIFFLRNNDTMISERDTKNVGTDIFTSFCVCCLWIDWTKIGNTNSKLNSMCQSPVAFDCFGQVEGMNDSVTAKNCKCHFKKMREQNRVGRGLRPKCGFA